MTDVIKRFYLKTLINDLESLTRVEAADNGIVYLINDVFVPPQKPEPKLKPKKDMKDDCSCDSKSKITVEADTILEAEAAIKAGANVVLNDMSPELLKSLIPYLNKLAESKTRTYHHEAKKNIVDIAIATKNLSTLVELLVEYKLVDTIKTSDNLTVLAPTNDAFNNSLVSMALPVPENLTDEQRKEFNELITEILLNHVIPTKATSGDLKNGQVVQTLNKDVKLTVSILDGRVLFDSGKNELPEVSTADIDASNGVVHVIDGVIVTPEQQKKFLTMNATWPDFQNQPTEKPTKDEPAPQPCATPMADTDDNKTPETNTLNLDSDTCGISIKTTLVVNIDDSIESSTTTTYTKCDNDEN